MQRTTGIQTRGQGCLVPRRVHIVQNDTLDDRARDAAVIEQPVSISNQPVSSISFVGAGKADDEQETYMKERSPTPSGSRGIMSRAQLERAQWSPRRHCLAQVVKSKPFDSCIGLVIVANSILTRATGEAVQPAARVSGESRSHPAPCTPAPCTLHPAYCILHTAHCITA